MDERKGGDEMSDVERRMAEHVAHTVVARMLEALQDKETASRVMDVWGGELDRTIGRGLRRAMSYILLALVALASVKLGIVEKLLSLFKP